MAAVRLHVNIDHVATLRNVRGTPYPDPFEAAKACLLAGADGITAHLREDRRHIRDADVDELRKHLSATLNLEMAPTEEMLSIACKLRPQVVTLVPERREEKTTEGGLNVHAGSATLERFASELRAAKIRVSLFIAPDTKEIEASHALGVEQVELHTGEYANAPADKIGQELDRLARAASFAHKKGLEVAAGHGLTRSNVTALMRIPEIIELNIGHAIIADALFLSLGGAVRSMREAMDKGRSP